jgi:hypothetical protein
MVGECGTYEEKRDADRVLVLKRAPWKVYVQIGG